jgi:hypothetical protein
MNQLVLHHHYTFGSTFDVSTFGNHGRPNLVTPGTGAFASALHFIQQDSRINVKPSQSLSNLVAISAMVRFYLEGLPAIRLNLIEGFVSFALFIEPTGAITGTIVDQDGDWSGTSSQEQLVTPGVWHEAWIIHDGVSQIQLLLDGTLVAQALNIYGPVKSVGQLGISIGNWPDAAAYPFVGYIDEVKLYRYDPKKDFQSLLNPCCFDGRQFDEILGELKRNKVLNVDGGYWRILQLLARIGGLLRGRDANSARSSIQLSLGMLRAIRARDVATLSMLQDDFSKLTASNPAAARDVRALTEKVSAIVDRAGLPSDLGDRLIKALCLKLPHQAQHPQKSEAKR